ncbi:glycerophosphodiester phosphodiesterase family protein [Actinosynnema sp. NPDC047251]|uniref:Glycerophosphoryl diester phosphodiesterase n=1 Tax=Saccharothrix espanaensis (strain ATCC 51144 / DSM 44229 / JCM 9112 / NBRC 15066 / NRRL 15764) TaxID=1179773 RepID=K0JRK8_SACES|nr:glycerophosphodiester phosphodiesterase family protein [Saccharothrix espanaensis]CCH27434.1 Glycerophosphoryl diester phosphodiesterase [Saccharothrix espanaensis DSM 44229]
MPPELIAHRGASALRPEHTLAAYELAVAQGADGVECDVRLTRDGHLVCVHDRTVDRTSDGRGVVSAMTLEELRRHDYGTALGGAPAPLLTFEDLLGLVADSGVRLFVETKHPVRHRGAVERALVEPLARHRVDAVMMSFSVAAVRRFKALVPATPTVLLFGRYWPQRLPAFADLPGPGVDLLRRHPGRGAGAYCWTVDEPADIALCVERGVRYLATNNPAQTRGVLAANLTPDQP